MTQQENIKLPSPFSSFSWTPASSCLCEIHHLACL